MTLNPIDGSEAVLSEDGTKYVDWPAIFGAVIVSSASTLLLGAVGIASGLAAVSPWTSNPSPTAMTVAGAAWFALSALYAGAVGGYVVGRLRKPAFDATSDERSNRDGLNALVAWGLGLLLTTLLTVSVLVSVAGKTASVAAQAAGPSLAEGVKASADKAGDFIGYYVDRAVRPANLPAGGANAAGSNDSKTEIARILTRGLANGGISGGDRADLEKIVARQAGISDADAKTRVDQMIAEANDAYSKAVQAAKEAADKARKIAASTTTWFAIVSLLAAILAWYAGVIGGRHRDQKLVV